MKAGLFELALSSLSGRRSKSVFVFLILTLLIFICSSVFFITASLRTESGYSADAAADITVRTDRGGRTELIKESYAEEILLIPGVEYAAPMYTGLYHFEYLKSNLTIVGIDPFAEQYSEDFSKAVSKLPSTPNWMVTGEKLAETLKAMYNKQSFSFALPNGEYLELPVAGTFKPASQMMSSSAVLTDIDSAGQILGIPEGRASYIAVYTGNPDETDNIAQKIAGMYPDTRVTTKKQRLAAEGNLFDFRSGVFMLIFSVSLFTFFIIVFDRASGLTAEERRETAILKAVGYAPSDIITVRLYEALIISVSAILTAVSLAMLYVYGMQAPLLKSVFTGYSYLRPEFALPFVFPAREMALTCLTVIPVYAAAVIIPAWRASVTDAHESLR
ncbi:ABC transporter permease [Seleniivibrio woodruffii]|uniref:ABC transporter permease n=1 Tax=Seleniivibrio woodruffii TaxID=1078050 RepID=UPI0024091867|nr:FtsX-like permease family protein [Seleniivibrio woodruffii]